MLRYWFVNAGIPKLHIILASFPYVSVGFVFHFACLLEEMSGTRSNNNFNSIVTVRNIVQDGEVDHDRDANHDVSHGFFFRSVPSSPDGRLFWPLDHFHLRWTLKVAVSESKYPWIVSSGRKPVRRGRGTQEGLS